MIACTILPHHIPDSGCFSYSEMFYTIIYLFISRLHLSYYREYFFWLDIFDFQRLVFLCK